MSQLIKIDSVVENDFISQENYFRVTWLDLASNINNL